MLDNNSLNAYAQPIQNKRIRLELLDFNYAVVDSIEGVCIGGNLTKNADDVLRRSGNLTICVPINPNATTFLDAVSGYTISYGGKIWLDKYVKISIGIDSMIPPYDTAWQTFGICLIDEPSRNFSATQYEISFSVIDLMARFTGLRFGQLTAITTMIEAVVQSGDTYTKTKTRDALTSVIKELGAIKMYSIYPIPQKYEYLPYDIKVEIGATVWELLSQFLNILVGWQMYFDDEGVFRVEPIPSGVHSITYPMSRQSLISATVSTDFQAVKNQVIVYGRTLEPTYTDTSGTLATAISVNIDPADATDFAVGATTIAFWFPNAVELPQTSSFTLIDINGSHTCNLTDFQAVNAYVPATQLIQGSYYVIQLSAATLNNDGTIDITQPMTWQWLGKQQISSCSVDDNRESPFYINNQLANSYWCGLCSPVSSIASDVFVMNIDDQNDPISALSDGMILTFMVTTTSEAAAKINVYSSDGTQIASQVPIYDNGVAIAAAKMYSDYTIFMVKYDSTNSRFDFLGRHPYALTKVLSGGVYDNIYADLLAAERSRYELYLSSSMQNNISLSVVPNYALDVNVKIPFSDNWAMPYDFAQTIADDTSNFIVKTVTYPLGINGTPQEIEAVQIYDNENYVGEDYKIPTTQAPKLGIPTISVSGTTLTITGASGATSFYVVAATTPTIYNVSFTLTERTADLRDYLSPDTTYLIAAVAKASGYRDSDNSNIVSFSYEGWLYPTLDGGVLTIKQAYNASSSSGTLTIE